MIDALAALSRATAAGRVLGLDVSRAEAVAAEASERLGLAPDAYVMALVGGTGVGKSTILNALAGEAVSATGPRRPTTTGAPIAWTAADAAVDVGPLLDRLGARQVRAAGPAGPDLGSVVVLDLPDVDSLDATHRATVEAVLPRIDVVAWVTDPEKYADAVLHDEFLRAWLPRLDRQIVILNKVDRLEPGSREAVVGDLRRVLLRELPESGGRPPAVVQTAAARGPDGVAELAAWIRQAADAKTVVAERLAAAARSAVADLALAAGVSPDGAATLVAKAEQRRAIDDATAELLRVIDIPGIERQAVGATRTAARRRGTGPMGALTSLVYRLAGAERRGADPAGYLRAWRERGGTTRAAEGVRRAIVDALPSIPPLLRARYAAATEARELERRLGEAVDGVVARSELREAPTSRLWPILGALQTANTFVLVVVAAWIVVWILARPPVESWDLPVLGPVPAPIVVLVAALVAGYLLARAVAIHAGWLGRRWAGRITGDLRTRVGSVVAETAFAPVAELDEARAALARTREESRPAPPASRHDV